MSVPAAYLGVVIIWSTTPLTIKWSGESNSFLLGVTGRMCIGAVLCILLIKILKVAFPWHRAARYSYIAASTAIYGAMLSTYWGAQFIPSGLVSVVFGFTPIVTSLLAALWLGERVLSPHKWIGMLLGIAGLVLIFHHQFNLGIEGGKGLLAVLMAVFFHSFSAVWIKRLNAVLSPLAITCGGLLISLPLYAITWLLSDMPWPDTLSTRTILSIVYLGVFGSVIGFMLYYYILKRIDAPRVALITLITPISALLLGQRLNDETISPTIWLGTLIVLGGLSIYQWGGTLLNYMSKNKVFES